MYVKTLCKLKCQKPNNYSIYIIIVAKTGVAEYVERFTKHIATSESILPLTLTKYQFITIKEIYIITDPPPCLTIGFHSHHEIIFYLLSDVHTSITSK